MKLGNNLDFVKNQALNLKLQYIGTGDASLTTGDEGLIWWDSVNKIAKVADGSVAGAGSANKITNVLEGLIAGTAISIGTIQLPLKTITVAVVPSTQSAAGSISALDKTKLDGISASANYIDDATLVHKAHVGTETITGDKTFSGAVTLPSGTTGLSKSNVGLGNVDNTTDDGKPISALTATALAAKADLVAGKIPTSQMPTLSLTTAVPVTNQASMLALTALQVQPGDVAIRTDGTGTWMLNAIDPSLIGSWTQLTSASDSVTSVNGQTGVVVLGKANVGLTNVDDTSDTGKPVSTAQATAIATKAATVHVHSGADITTGTVTMLRGGTGNVVVPAQWGATYAASTTSQAHTAAGTTDQVLTAVSGAAPIFKTLDMTMIPNSTLKKSVRAASTVNLGLSAPTTVDGIALIAGDRCLVKNQTLPAANGIYIVQAAAWTRVPGADTAAEMSSAFVAIDSGTQGGTHWTNSFKATDILGTTACNWASIVDSSEKAVANGIPTLDGSVKVPYAQINIGTAASTVAAGDHAHTKAQIGLTNVDDTSDAGKPVSTAQATANNLRLLTSNDLSEIIGTHKVTARNNIGAIGKFAMDIGTTNACVVPHLLNTTDVTVNVFEKATKLQIITDIEHTDANNITIRYAVAPGAGLHRVIVTG